MKEAVDTGSRGTANDNWNVMWQGQQHENSNQWDYCSSREMLLDTRCSETVSSAFVCVLIYILSLQNALHCRALVCLKNRSRKCHLSPQVVNSFLHKPNSADTLLLHTGQRALCQSHPLTSPSQSYAHATCLDQQTFERAQIANCMATAQCKGSLLPIFTPNAGQVQSWFRCASHRIVWWNILNILSTRKALHLSTLNPLDLMPTLSSSYFLQEERLLCKLGFHAQQKCRFETT